MSSEIISNSYKYIIDTSYGINKDGFIAIGTESIVYKGLKTRNDGELQFSCVLKFKPKFINVNGEVVDRLSIFKNEEKIIFDELRECRSVVRIDDIVEDIGDFSLPCDKIRDGIINNKAYFCVVEEYIDGWSLEEYCREEFWKLRKKVALPNGLCNVVNFHEFSETEKKDTLANYTYDNILKYQNQIMLFMINLCEILQFVTQQKQILHLDIKPDNIMVTRHGKELVLIDFGRSKKITKAERFVKNNLAPVNYNEDEQLINMYQYGSLGYAAPECFAQAEGNSEFPFSMETGKGMMSIESDIFSFGATFWECLNIFELVTQNPEFSEEPYDFYKNNLLNDALYFKRNLSCTSLYYHKKLENIIVKCTQRRNNGYNELENEDYYHSYDEIKKDLAIAKDSAPTIVKEENVRVKNSIKLCAIALAFFFIFLIIQGIFRSTAFSVAERKWESLAKEYNDTKFYKLEEVANELVDTAVGTKKVEVLNEIMEFTHKDSDITEYEAELLVDLILKIGNKNIYDEKTDEIMKFADAKKFKSITTSIMRMGSEGGSTGYETAKAIYDVEVCNSGILEAFNVLEKNKDKKEYINAIIKLRNVLDSDVNIEKIAKEKGVNRREISAFLDRIRGEQ